ncbi:hypothetical protein [Ectorhizobium quercum]|uniref:hypothetical protein n=1 Tax=Ectorhizobium quercum TaxID=2965071 RepID=UPI003521E779
MRARLKASLPGKTELLAGAPVWGMLMALSAAASLHLGKRLDFPTDTVLLALYFAGGALGWSAALPLARFCAAGRRPDTRLASCLFWLSVATVGITALLFALQYRSFYAQWHAPFMTRIWLNQFVFTSASAVYQFAVMGLRLYLPLGFVFLLAASAIMARRIR